jgi:antitoxin MazE
MKADLIRIGNSQGIRIPRAVIDQCGFGRRVEMRVEGENLIITRTKAVRSGWDETFEAMAAQGDDAPLLPGDLENRFDRTEWEWRAGPDASRSGWSRSIRRRARRSARHALCDRIAR